MKKATLYDYARMCKYFDDDGCQECPVFYKQTETGLSCEDFIRHCPDKANEIILKWCEEYPIKTRQSEFLKMFPNAKINNGVVVICPKNVEATLRCDTKDCGKCREEYWLTEVDENE